MAEKKKKKKFVKILACLLFVAIVVGGILLFVPTDKTSLVETLSSVNGTMLLQDSGSDGNYSQFKDKIVKNNSVQVYSGEMEAIEKISDSIGNVVEYYNYYIKFAQSNRIYKNQNGKAKRELNSAMQNVNSLNSIISETNKMDAKATILKNAWVDYRSEFLKYLTHCENAFNALGEILCGCFGEAVTVNEATKTKIKAVNDYMSALKDKVGDMVDSDKTSSNTSDFSLTYKGIAEKFKIFTDKYFGEDKIDYDKGYFFDTDLNTYSRNNYKAIIEFLQTNSFKSIIEKINNDGTYNLDFDVDSVVTKYIGGSL